LLIHRDERVPSNIQRLESEIVHVGFSTDRYQDTIRPDPSSVAQPKLLFRVRQIQSWHVQFKSEMHVDAGGTQTYEVRYDHMRGIERIWLAGSTAPRVDGASLDASQPNVIDASTLYGDATTTLTLTGAGFDPAATVRLDGTLGLAIVSKIVQDHSGSVSIEQTSESGTTMLVRLPAAEQAVADRAISPIH